MKVEELVPLPKERVTFKLASFKFVPKVGGCYVITTFDCDILYIGLSENLYERFQQHLNNPDKISPTKNGKAIWFYFLNFNSKNLYQLERTWINQYVAMHGQLPILNKVNSPLA